MINTYRQPSRLIVLGGQEITSEECTTQGDNLAMSFYALGTTAQLNFVKANTSSVKQVLFADDASAADKLISLKEWWNVVITEGAKIGYYVNECKSLLTTKSLEREEEAKNLFSDTAIKIITERKRHLGAVIGKSTFQAPVQ